MRLFGLIAAIVVAAPAWADDDVPSEKRKAGGDDQKQYFLIGADVLLSCYEGGHGWHGKIYDDVRSGIEWLEKRTANKK